MIVLYTDKTAPTARNIAHIFEARAVRNLQNRQRPDWVLRWGASTRIPMRPANGTINKRTAISAAANKFEALATFRQAGVPVPEYLDLGTNGTGGGWTVFPALARLHNHQQGRDIVLCLQWQDVTRFRARHDEAAYLIQYIPTQLEYRIHVFGNEIIKASQKVLTHENQYCPWIRNVEHGYTFRTPQTNPSAMVRNAAVSAVQALGLDFGAVDVIVSDNGMPYVLEVNTGPRLIASSLRIYAENIARVTNRQYNPERLAEIERQEQETEANQTEE